MAVHTTTTSRYTCVAVHPASPVGEHHRATRKAGARAAGFPPDPKIALRNFGGRTIRTLTFTNVYLGGDAAWDPDEMQKIDWAISAAMRDTQLNNVLAQYYASRPTSRFVPSEVLDGPLPARVYRGTVEGFVAALERSGSLSALPPTSTVVNFLLPRGVLLSDKAGPGHHEREHDEDKPPRFNPTLAEHDALDSLHGLGGYHGSIHPKHGAKTGVVYYSVAVYSEGDNGIVSFAKPWKNIAATLYHELCEARTDPDVEDSIRAGDTPASDRFLGWYSPHGGEIGDIPMDAAGDNLRAVLKEVPLARGEGRVPIQLMWSNAVAGPEGPCPTMRRPSH
jgi:hypothetical protein